MNNCKIGFRKLQEYDLVKVCEWLNNDFVNKWYGNGKESYTLEEVKRRYTPRINGIQPTYCYIITYDKKDIGLIQTYLINDYPDYSKYVEPREKAAGLDLFIGEKDYLNKGIGKQVISKFLKDYVFRLTNAVSCIIAPEPKNLRAIKAYKKVGFTYLKTIKLPYEPEPEYLMRMEAL